MRLLLMRIFKSSSFLAICLAVVGCVYSHLRALVFRNWFLFSWSNGNFLIFWSFFNWNRMFWITQLRLTIFGMIMKVHDSWFIRNYKFLNFRLNNEIIWVFIDHRSKTTFSHLLLLSLTQYFFCHLLFLLFDPIYKLLFI